MDINDEILFSGEFKDFRKGIYYSLRGASESDVASAIANILNSINEPAFDFSGINTKKVRDFIKLNGSGLPAVISFLESKKPAELRAALIDAAGKNTLLPAAECCFFYELFKSAGVACFLTSSMFKSAIKPKEEKPGDQIVFIGHYKDWAAIKKLSINQKTEAWEVSGILSGIVFSLVPKVFQFAGASDPSVEVLKLCAGKRKSYVNVIDMLKQIHPGGNQFQDAFLLLRMM